MFEIQRRFLCELQEREGYNGLNITKSTSKHTKIYMHSFYVAFEAGREQVTLSTGVRFHNNSRVLFDR
jgi:hypothetical protein